MVIHKSLPIREYSIGSARFGDSYENKDNQKVHRVHHKEQA